MRLRNGFDPCHRARRDVEQFQVGHGREEATDGFTKPDLDQSVVALVGPRVTVRVGGNAAPSVVVRTTPAVQRARTIVLGAVPLHIVDDGLAGVLRTILFGWPAGITRSAP